MRGKVEFDVFSDRTVERWEWLVPGEGRVALGKQ